MQASGQEEEAWRNFSSLDRCGGQGPIKDYKTAHATSEGQVAMALLYSSATCLAPMQSSLHEDVVEISPNINVHGQGSSLEEELRSVCVVCVCVCVCVCVYVCAVQYIPNKMP